MAIFDKLRRKYHKNICARLLGSTKGYPDIADVSSKSSILISTGIINELGFKTCQNPPSSQTIGAEFSTITMDFINAAFKHLNHLRPGKWIFSASQARSGIAAFDQYEHLTILKKLMSENKELSLSIGGDYLIIPDIIVARSPESDTEINKFEKLIDKKLSLSTFTPLRKLDSKLANPILHASISCKWTIRSDRVQNTRTEALNLIRNRKGNTPHIMAITAEPLPTRIAAIALGTGDIDCVYHMALHELVKSANRDELADQYDMLMTMIEGKRLRDISDLVFDLAI